MGNTASSPHASVLPASTDDGRITAFVQQLSRGLDDDLLPGICPDCLESAYGKAKALGIDHVRTICHEIFHKCMRVLTRRRSEDETQVLRDQLQRALQDCPKVHTFERGVLPGAIAPRDPLHAFIETLYSIIDLAINNGSRAPITIHEKPKRAPGHKENLWPTKIGDLLPFCANECATAHVLWCSTLSSPEPFIFVASAILAFRTTLIPHILQSPLKEKLLWTLVCMLYTDVSCAIRNWPGPIPCADSPSPRDVFWSNGPAGKALSVTLVGQVFQAVSHGLEGSLTYLYTLVAGYEDVLLTAMICNLSTLDDANLSNSIRGVHRTMHVYLARMAIELARISGRPPSVIGPDLLRLTTHLNVPSGPLPVLSEILDRRFMSRDCYGPSCKRSVHDNTTGKPFPRCARCKFVQYCSKECQLEDWKEAEVPHKELCPLLKKLINVGKRRSYVETEAEFKKTGLDVLDDCAPIFTWGVLHGDLNYRGVVDVEGLLSHWRGQCTCTIVPT